MLAAVISDTHGVTGDIIKTLTKYEDLDAIFFLGDYYMDGERIAHAYPNLQFFGIAGNGDRYMGVDEPTEKTVELGGKTFFIAHGHNHHVKGNLDGIAAAGIRAKADAVLFGHTHVVTLAKAVNDMWLINPGSAAFPRGIEDATFALLEWKEDTDIMPMILEVSDGTLLYTGRDFFGEQD